MKSMTVPDVESCFVPLVVNCCNCAASVAAVAAPSPVILKFESGIFAVIGVCPSFAMDCVNAVAMSFRVVFAQVELIVVPVTTAARGKLYAPEPLRDMY